MKNEPIAWMEIEEGGITEYKVWREPVSSKSIPLYTHPVNPYQSITNTKIEPTVVSYTHPVKELNEAIKIIKDFQSDDVPPCKSYEDTYADGWMDACNEILWAIEDKAQEK